jgi:hypothetical protein
VPRPGALAAPAQAWAWDADEQRDLAQLCDALHDHRHRRATRSEVRVRYWEFRARESSAPAAAAWGRALLARLLGPPDPWRPDAAGREESAPSLRCPPRP